MNGRIILYLLGKIIYFLGLIYAVPLLLAFVYEDAGRWIFAVCMPLCFLLGGTLT